MKVSEGASVAPVFIETPTMARPADETKIPARAVELRGGLGPGPLRLDLRAGTCFDRGGVT